MFFINQIMSLGLLVIHIRVYVALRAAIMPKSKNIHKIPISTQKVTEKVSEHRFSGSRNHIMTKEMMCYEQKTLMGAL